MSRPLYPIFLPSAGCSSRCIYCNQEACPGASPVNLAPSEVVSWVRSVAARPGNGTIPGELAYYGGTFTALPPAVQAGYLAAAGQLANEGLIGRVRVSTHPAHVSEPVARYLLESGVTDIELGVQSFSDDVLAGAFRNHTALQARNAVQLLFNSGLDVCVQLMFFLPLSTEESDLESVRLAVSLSPASLRLFPTLVLRSTQLADRFMRGEYVPATLEEAIDRCAKALGFAREAGIPIIRMGIQDSDGLRGHLIAGPHHPAFGELVLGRRLASELLNLVLADPGHAMRINLPRVQASLLLGHGRHGLRYIEQGLRLEGRLSPNEQLELNLV